MSRRQRVRVGTPVFRRRCGARGTALAGILAVAMALAPAAVVAQTSPVPGAARPSAPLPGTAPAVRPQEDIRETLARLDSLLALSAPPADAFREAARLWLGAGRPDTVAVILSRGVTAHPSDPALWALLGHAREGTEEWPLAAAAYREASAWVQDPLWLDLRRAGAQHRAGDTDGALRTLRDAVGPRGAPVARILAARAAHGMGSPELARELVAGGGEEVPVLAEESVRMAPPARRAPALEALAASGSPWAVAERVDAGALEPGAGGGADGGRALLRHAIRNGIQRVGQGESLLLSGGLSLEVTGEALITGRDLQSRWVLEQLEADRADLETLLETAILRRPWGGEELALLREGYPGSALLGRYQARLALGQGAPGEAEEVVRRLLDRQPRDAALHRLHGEILEAREDLAGARRSYGVALELDPADPEAFGSLVRLHQAHGSLEPLLERVRRLRTLEPRDPVRWDRELELLHRMGRLDEARELAARRPSTGGTA